ncbi:zinc finger and BTB domain-containing protein 24 isoform X2 [Hyla sarda]|uniref:zinc finger and BTB domain-containing protein 24 isoform X2 n=1 Tax=Hyla sarda TaxID=327740 RepID=UPI0024C2ABB0|nr:zinc finger and BTB domain-containing protein 24 isoform X2 [Hyla sarda]
MEDTVHQLELETEVQINIHSSCHMDTVLSRLEEQRKKNFLCDITLVVETVQFRAHKALLAANSEYFSMMFADEGNIGQSIYVIEGVVSEVFETLLQFIYTGNVHVSEKCLKQIVGTAQVLKVDNLVKAYAEYQQNLLKHDAETSDDKSLEEADDPGSKRKRGRPKKQCDQNNTQEDPKSETQTEKDIDNAAVPGSMEDTCYTNGNILHEHEVADFAAEVTCDLNPKPPEEPLILKRHSKRRSQRSVKLQDYRLGEDGEDSVPTKHSAGKKKQPMPELSCKDCGKVFKYKHFFAIHRRTHTGECPFKCSQCGQGFSQKHSLRVHERIHTGERPYSCTVCSKSLATKNSLMEHMRIHAEKKAFTCDKCGKFYSQKRQLKSHYRVHIGEKPYTCEVCGKSFTAKSSLLTHMRIHRGEKPYSCNICGKSFGDSSAKRRHITLHAGKKPFSCSKCNVQFTRMDNLKAHIKSHSKEKKPKPPATTTSTKVNEGSGSVMQMQQYQLATPNQQEIQVLVSDNVNNLNFMSGQGQGISIVTTEASPSIADHAANLALIAHQPPALRGLPVASHQHQVQQIHNIDMESRVQTVLPEQMHVVTLSKEAFDQLQGRTHEIHLTQTNRPAPPTLVQAPSAPSISNQSVRAPEQAQQTLPTGPVTQSAPIVTLSKEAFDQLQGRTHEIHLTQTDRSTPLTRVQASPAPAIRNQSVRAPEQAQQTLPVGPVTQSAHVVTLSKEAFDQLQGRTHEIHLTQTDRPTSQTRVQAPSAPSILNQSARAPEQAQQSLPVGSVTQPAHVVTLSKEAFDQLQGRTHEIHLTQTDRPTSQTRVQAPSAPSILNQSARAPEQAQQTLPVGSVPQPAHVVTLSKEAFDQLQGWTHEIHLTQTDRPTSQTRGKAPTAPSNLNQSVRTPEQAQQTLPVGSVTQHVPIVTLSKEAFEQLQGRTHEIHFTQRDRSAPLTRVQAPPASPILNQSVRASVQAQQNLPVGRVPQSTPIVTLSKEAFDQLQGRTHEIYLTQTDRPAPITRVQASPAPSTLNQSVRATVQAQHTFPMGSVTQPASIVTLSKEAFDQLQGRTHEIHFTQTDRPAPLTRVQAPPTPSNRTQSARASVQAQQTLPVVPVTQPAHVVTLSKEAFEQLQGRTHEIYLTQTDRPASLTRVQAPPTPSSLNQSGRASVQAQQTLPGGPVTQPVPIVTLSKEAFEQLQGRTHEIHLTQTDHAKPQTRVHAPAASSTLNQSVRASVQAPQTLPVGSVPQPAPGQLVQAQTFQRPASAVPFASTTMDTPNSSSI